MSELKQCQCDYPANIHTEAAEDYSELYYVECSSCYMRTGGKKNKEDAVREWNNRVIEDALLAEIDQLKHAIANLQQQLYFKNLPAVGVEG